MWAFPHQYDAEAPTDTTVQIGLGTGGIWHLLRLSGGWALERGPAPEPAATLDLNEMIAWRQLTGLPVPDDEVSAEGPDSLVRPLLQVRGIIA